MAKPRILSGIQPTGKLHIGNYLGALKNFVGLQNSGKYECFFAIVDLHSLTEEYEPKAKTSQIIDLAATFLAAGLDPKKSTIFLQSEVPAHTELAWLLSTLTPMGELVRMTQYKDKASRQAQNINVGLFTYPVLMAADILLYNTAPEVPIGSDQTQHLELTRILARKFNKRFGKTFVEPKGVYTAGARIMSLVDPARKMSKSEPGGCLFLDDEPAEIMRKVKAAVTATDSADKNMPAGVANLFLLLREFGTKADSQKFEKLYQAGKLQYSELKETLARAIAEHFADFRTKRKELAKNPEKVRKLILEGSKKAEKVAIEKLKEVKMKIGLAL